VTLALNTGMRQGELLRLPWDSVDLERNLITVKQSKTLRLKTIAMNELAREAVAWLQQNRYGDLLFLWPWGEPLGRTTVHDAFKRACTEAGITDFRFHDLRHTFASHLVMAGGGFVTVEGFIWPFAIYMIISFFHPLTQHKTATAGKLGP